MLMRDRVYVRLQAFVVTIWVVGIVAFFLSSSAAGAVPRVDVLIWTSPEKQNVIEPALDRFNAQHNTVTEGGQRYVVHARSIVLNSGDMHDLLVRRLAQGVEFPAASGGAPTVVTPSTSDWLAQINLEAGRPVFDVEGSLSLARTAVVIFTYREMAECLGWPRQPIGWTDLITLAERPEGWASCPTAHAEWGRKPLVAFTDPTVSSTARSTLQLLHVIAAGKPAEALTPEDVADPKVRELVRRFQSTVDHYYPEIISLETKIYQGPRFVHFAPLEEYTLPWLYQGKAISNSGAEQRPPIGWDVVAIYPKEGTVWHDNPFAIPSASWVSAPQRAAALAVQEYLLSDEVQREFVEWGFRPGTSTTLTPVQSLESQQPTQPVGRLSAAAAQAIQQSWEDVKKPGVVVLVVDTSTSMNGARLDQLRTGVRRFLDSAARDTHVGLVTFSSTLGAQVPVGPLAATRFAITDALDTARGSGNTDLYDAVQTGISMVDGYDGVEGEAIRGVVVLTDGAVDIGRGLSDLIVVHDHTEQVVPVHYERGVALHDLLGAGLASPTRSPVHLFTVGVGPDADVEALRILAEATSGATMRVETADEGLSQLLGHFSKYF